MTFPFRVVDLTHTLDANIPTWTGSCGFDHIIKQDYDDAPTTPGFRVQQIKMHASAGTHMDAPCHCVPEGMAIADIDVKNLCVPVIVMNVSAEAHDGAYRLRLASVRAFENQHNPQWRGALVLVHTGWSQYWCDRAQYTNNHVFPSISGDVAQYWVDQGVVGVGIDTLSPDKPADGFPVHVALLNAGRYILENVARADLMPAVGAFAIVAPLKTKEGAEAPTRLLGLL